MAKQPPSQTKWASDWSVGVRVSIERAGGVLLDQAIADLLLAVDRTHSISGAAREVGISYRHAWLVLQGANENSGQPLTTTSIGGQRGGGAELTEHGRAALAVFRQVQQQVGATAARAVPRIVGSIDPHSRTLHVAVAISLQEVIASLLRDYALVRPTTRVRTLLAASNTLADQIEGGASIDLFFAASGAPIDRLAKSGLVVQGSRRKLAANGLAIVGHKSLVGKLTSAADLEQYDQHPLVVADPACPLGACTARFLQGAKLTKSLEPRIEVVENSRAVVAALRAPGKRFGIVFESDATTATGLALLHRLPRDLAATEYEAALITTSTGGETGSDEAQQLLDFITSPAAQPHFRRHGFS